jgi:hypothetical protein
LIFITNVTKDKRMADERPDPEGSNERRDAPERRDDDRRDDERRSADRRGTGDPELWNQVERRLAERGEERRRYHERRAEHRRHAEDRRVEKIVMDGWPMPGDDTG